MQYGRVNLRSVNIIVRDAQGRTLLQMRDGAAMSSPLLWGFWGGAVDANDENACHAAARELREELCVVASPAQFVALGERIDSRGQVAALVLYTPALQWQDIYVNEGAGAAFFWREEIERLPVAKSITWYLERHAHIFSAQPR